jgi:hypothetical protein
MKNLLWTIMLITALAVVFTLTACGDDDGDEPLSITITGAATEAYGVYGAWTDDVLTVRATPSDATITCFWEDDDGNITSGVTFTPTEVGSYYLTVSNGIEMKFAEFLVGPKELKGTWKATIVGGSANGEVETVVITPALFKLDSTATSDSVNGGTEFFYFTIDTWAKMSTGVPAAYSVGYTVTGTAIEDGYTGAADYTMFNIFYSSTPTIKFRRTQGNGTTQIERDYTRPVTP